MFVKLINWFSRKRDKIQTFTYYIPSPPARKSGYREKEFDKIFRDFIAINYEIISLHTQSNTGPQGQGMWIICLVRQKNKTLSNNNYLDLELSFSGPKNEDLKSNSVLSNQDDLYYSP